MAFSVAVAGKGGTGKTTLASLLIGYLMKNNKTPILAVDADANANLSEGLGLGVRETVGGVLAEFETNKISLPPGMPKETYLDFRLNEILVEGQGLDLLVMGRGEGSGCYCYPNAVLRKYLDDLSGNYRYLVIDNEAGMEHLSRRTTRDIDVLLIVSDPTMKGIRTAGRIKELAAELDLNIAGLHLVVNRVVKALPAELREEIDRQGLALAGTVPADESVYQCDLRQEPLTKLDSSPAAVAVRGIAETLGI